MLCHLDITGKSRSLKLMVLDFTFVYNIVHMILVADRRPFGVTRRVTTHDLIKRLVILCLFKPQDRRCTPSFFVRCALIATWNTFSSKPYGWHVIPMKLTSERLEQQDRSSRFKFYSMKMKLETISCTPSKSVRKHWKMNQVSTEISIKQKILDQWFVLVSYKQRLHSNWGEAWTFKPYKSLFNFFFTVIRIRIPNVTKDQALGLKYLTKPRKAIGRSFWIDYCWRTC